MNGRLLKRYVGVCVFLKVGDGVGLENENFAVPGSGGGATVPWYRPTTPPAQTATEKIVWGLGKFLLSAGESVNSAWDMALDAALRMLKTGGAIYDSAAGVVGYVPLLGYGASGVGEAIKVSLAVTESNVKHDMDARKRAFETLNQKLTDGGRRLYGPTTGINAAVANPVVFPAN